MKYRIEITELKNGRKRYQPQVEITEIRGSILTKREVTEWVNIIKGYPSNPTYDTTRTGCDNWGTEEEALEVIQGHKERIRVENGAQPSNVTYKMID
jgi:hypothetical protein